MLAAASVDPVQRGPKPGWSAAEADGELEIGTVEGAVVVLLLGIAGVDHVEVALPAIAGADLDPLDLIGEAEAEIDERDGDRLRPRGRRGRNDRRLRGRLEAAIKVLAAVVVLRPLLALEAVLLLSRSRKTQAPRP